MQGPLIFRVQAEVAIVQAFEAAGPEKFEQRTHAAEVGGATTDLKVEVGEVKWFRGGLGEVAVAAARCCGDGVLRHCDLVGSVC